MIICDFCQKKRAEFTITIRLIGSNQTTDIKDSCDKCLDLIKNQIYKPKCYGNYNGCPIHTECNYENSCHDKSRGNE